MLPTLITHVAGVVEGDVGAGATPADVDLFGFLQGLSYSCIPTVADGDSGRSIRARGRRVMYSSGSKCFLFVPAVSAVPNILQRLFNDVFTVPAEPVVAGVATDQHLNNEVDSYTKAFTRMHHVHVTDVYPMELADTAYVFWWGRFLLVRFLR